MLGGDLWWEFEVATSRGKSSTIFGKNSAEYTEGRSSPDVASNRASYRRFAERFLHLQLRRRFMSSASASETSAAAAATSTAASTISAGSNLKVQRSLLLLTKEAHLH